MNWLDKLIFRIFKWKFYNKFNDPKKYYTTILIYLNDDYAEMYFASKNKLN